VKTHLALLLVLTACADDAGSRCRLGNAFSQSGRAFAGQTNYSANALENMRCDLIEAQQRAEARERERDAREHRREQEQEDEAQARANWAMTQKLRALRMDPKSPSLENTKREAESICMLATERRGQWVDQGDKVGCKIGGITTFACDVGDNGEMDRCTKFRESAELDDVKSDYEADYGAPTTTEVSSAGFHVTSEGERLTSRT
jgi:hypothetical protein